jgi:putative aldouronate transport system substrate-binding protein
MLEYVFAPFFMPAATEWWQDTDGKIKPPELHPSYKDMMAKFVEWQKKGYIWPDMLLSTAPKQQELIAQNKAGTVAATFSGTIINAVEVLRKTVPDAQYVPVALEGKGINKLPASAAATSAWVIFKKNASPETVMKYFDFQATPEGSDLVYFGVEGENYNRGANNTIEFIAEDKSDLSKAKYYAKYKTVFINWPGKPVWSANTWVHQEYNLKREQVHKLPRFEPIDAKVLYDNSKWKSFSKLTDLKTYWSEQKIKVFNGEIPVENWDSIVKKWLEIGGQQMIDDRNEQFAAAAK